METVVIKTRFRSGKGIEDVRYWFDNLRERLPEVIQSMEAEGVFIESAIHNPQPDGHYLIYYMRAQSISRAYEVFKSSMLAIDSDYKQGWSYLFEGREELEVLFDAERTPISSQ